MEKLQQQIFDKDNLLLIYPRDILINIIPAQAGIYTLLVFLDPRLRGSDENRINQNIPRFIAIRVNTEVLSAHHSLSVHLKTDKQNLHYS